MRKHELVRQQKDEFEKIERIEQEIGSSLELRQVQKEADVEEFEVTTNKEFNKNYEQSLMSIDSSQFIRPIMSSRRGANRVDSGGTTLQNFEVDEKTLKNFSFKGRYIKNKSSGRQTSTVNKIKNF
mmetsp:Transcript_13211/g.22410  ORF Transcript_13211/g.22410 Transcript_13211/m.22410 type:complete len:126 (+) Transcript_13211:595-972(+)